MPPTPPRAKKSAAFTLVEMMTAIFLAMLIIGIAVLSIGAVNEEASIRRIGSTLEATARAALQTSVLKQRDHWITFSSNDFTAAPNGKTYSLPKNSRIELRHWGEKSWSTPATDERWHFSHEGLCEPLQVRLTLGKATLEMQFDPLTGAVADESLIVEKG
jgi:hypothetical protein